VTTSPRGLENSNVLARTVTLTKSPSSPLSYDSIHTHGTGCTLSSAIASALALGHQRREIVDKTGANYEGATSAIDLADACCLAKAYVSAGIGRGVGLGKGSGPVVHTHFPSSCRHYPSIAMDPEQRQLAEFRSIRAWSSDANVAASEDVPVLGRILPIVDSVEWVERLVNTPGVSDIQLRVKDETVPDRILERVHHCEKLCRERKVRLWVNDHWKAAIRAGCFGVHVGQEDLVKCAQAGGLEALRSANVALGVSTHSYGELAAALAVRPSYISLGPVFGTASKKVNFDPQGLSMVTRWRGLIPPHIPLVTIGGISDVTAARRNQEAGADCVAVIGAVTQSPDVAEAVRSLNKAMV
jgi:thiamine-phosphate diphosphorylase